MNAHIPTAFLMVIAVSAALCVSVAVVSRRSQKEGMVLWAMGLACHTGAYALYALGHLLDPWAAVVAPNVLITVCFAMFTEALLQFQQQGNRRLAIWWPVAGVVAVLPLLLDDIGARIVWMAGLLTYQNLHALWLLWRQRRSTVGRGQHLLMMGFGVLSVLFVVRGIATFLGMNEISNLTASSQVQMATFLVGSICLIFLAIGFLTMTKERAEARNGVLAMRDELTGVHNRRSILEVLEQQMAVVQRHDKPLCVLLLDIDHFKRVNDTYGHMVGDHALREITRVVSDRLRTEDSVGRYGGEEFLLVLPGTGQDTGLEVAERLRRDIAAMPLRTPAGEPMPLTVSIGLTEFDLRRHFSTDDLVNEADHALYAAKGAGRNRCVVSDAKMAAAPITVPADH